jgi:hypothetical protein
MFNQTITETITETTIVETGASEFRLVPAGDVIDISQRALNQINWTPHATVHRVSVRCGHPMTATTVEGETFTTSPVVRVHAN